MRSNHPGIRRHRKPKMATARQNARLLRPPGRFLADQFYLEGVFGHAPRDFRPLHIIPARRCHCAR